MPCYGDRAGSYLRGQRRLHAGCLGRRRHARDHHSAATRRWQRAQQLAGGIAYLGSHPQVRWLQGVLLVAMTGILGVETLLPAFAAGTWHTGSAGYGLLRMAPGIAAVLAGLALSVFPPGHRRALALTAAFAGAGAAIGGFAVAPAFILALLLLAGGSLCLTVTQVIAGTIVQQATADAMRGRISALGSAGQNGLAGIAAAATTALATRIGPNLAVGMLAATTATAGILLSLLATQRRAYQMLLPFSSLFIGGSGCRDLC